MIIIRSLINLTQLLLQLLDALGFSAAAAARALLCATTSTARTAWTPRRALGATTRGWARCLLWFLDIERSTLAFDDELVELPDGTWRKRIDVDFNFVAVLRKERGKRVSLLESQSTSIVLTCTLVVA